MRKLLGWNRAARGVTRGYSFDGDLRYEIARNNVRGVLYFTVLRVWPAPTAEGVHVGDKGSIGLAKDLAEGDALLLSRRKNSKNKPPKKRKTAKNSLIKPATPVGSIGVAQYVRRWPASGAKKKRNPKQVLPWVNVSYRGVKLWKADTRHGEYSIRRRTTWDHWEVSFWPQSNIDAGTLFTFGIGNAWDLRDAKVIAAEHARKADALVTQGFERADDTWVLRAKRNPEMVHVLRGADFRGADFRGRGGTWATEVASWDVGWRKVGSAYVSAEGARIVRYRNGYRAWLPDGTPVITMAGEVLFKAVGAAKRAVQSQRGITR